MVPRRHGRSRRQGRARRAGRTPRNSLRPSGLSTPRAAPRHHRSAHRSLDQDVVRPAAQGGPARQSLADRGHLASLRPARPGGCRMTTGPITLTVGWISRHTPPGAGVDGRDAAVIDIAQDLLLRDLHERGSLDALVFKGGTSLRKLYAGNQGRFSLDLDFSVADPASDADTVVLQLVSAIDGTTIGPFTYGVTERRGKWSLTIQSPFGADESTLSSLLDSVDSSAPKGLW